MLVVDDTNTIVSKWFIIEAVRTRAGQWQLTLHRDVVVDYLNLIVDAPMYIEKAIVPDSDSAIYNSEGVAVNQIKTKEYLLKDRSRCAWLVGYFNRDFEQTPITVTYSNPSASVVLPEGETIDDYLLGEYAYRLGNVKISFDYVNEFGGYFSNTAFLSSENNFWDASSKITSIPLGVDPGFVWWNKNNSVSNSSYENVVAQLNLLNAASPETILSQASMYFTTTTRFNPTKYNTLRGVNSMLVKDGTGKV